MARRPPPVRRPPARRSRPTSPSIPTIAKADLSLLEALGVRQHAPGRDRQLPGEPERGPLPVPAAPGRPSTTTQAGARAAIERFEAYLAARARRPRGALAAEPRLHGARAATRRTSRRHLLLSERCSGPKRRCRASSTWPRPPASDRRDIAGGTIADDFDGDGLLDVVFSSVDYCAPLRLYRNRGDGTFEDRTEQAGPPRPARRPERRPDRLQQRRPARHLRDAGRLGDAHAQLPAAQQRRRHVHRRDQEAGLLERRPRHPLGGLGRLRQRRLARRLRRPRAHPEPALPQPRRRHVRGRHRAGRRGGHRLHQGRDLGRLRQGRLPRPLRLEHVRATTSSTTTTATARSPRSAAKLGSAEAPS